MRHHSNNHYQRECEGLLKYYNTAETPSSVVISIPRGTSETGLQIPLNLKGIGSEDRVELISTIKWITSLGGISVIEAIIPITEEVVTTNEATINYVLEVPITFNVYRDGELICTSTDVKSFLYSASIPSTVTSTTSVTRLYNIALRPLSSTTGASPAATTTFQCIDSNVPKGDHVYTITAQISLFSLTSSTTVLSTTSTEIPLIPIITASGISTSSLAAVTSATFSGKVIDGCEGHCRDEFA
ncbi:hypothetical protein [Halobacillus sp. K22]|uniref:hypothetical protein n=1 Tax=Halobacillus sp. K22 TaxID=3457431 RepID=UPI003FCD817D